MTLYQIDQGLLSLIDPETGELLDYEAFANLQMEREQKLENMALWYKELSAEAKAIKEEADSLTERRKSVEARAERLKNYLSLALDGQKFQTARCQLSFRKTTSLEVADDVALIKWAESSGYDDCVRRKAPEVSKSAVTALIKAGVTVPFAQLVDGKSLAVK